MNEADHEVITAGAQTAFRVRVISNSKSIEDLLDDLDRCLGSWTRVFSANECTLVVAEADPDGSFSFSDSQCMLSVFDRDGSEAKVFEWSPYLRNFKALRRSDVEARTRKTEP